MSQSPTNESTIDQVRQYDVGWAATNKLIRQGNSFSGGERHCAFLNMGEDGGRFATISGASGLDLIDDGRGLALCDWDYDGRTDLWLTNRTGPRLRFIHNRWESGGRFVSLRLRGTNSNRDAIGARVKIEFAEGALPVQRTVYAGGGYLSQSSKRQTIGLGAEAITSVTVRWPGGQSERFEGVVANGFFELVEGAGAAEAWEPPRFDPAVLVASPIAAAEDLGASRVLPVQRPPLPDSIGLEGNEGAPLVVMLWATWCPNCEVQMAEWNAASAEIEASGAKVLALCVDEEADLEAAKSVAAERGFPWVPALAETRLIDVLNVVQKSYVGRQEDLPLPSIFLIDARSELVAVYKGGVAADVLLKDLSIAKGGESREEIVALALPYEGRWLERPPATLPRSIAIGLVEHGFADEAKRYLEQLLPLYASADADPAAERSRVQELSECRIFLGALAYDAGEKGAAAEHYRAALELAPLKREARRELMRCLIDLGKPAEAAEQVEALLAERPDDFENLAQLAGLRAETGETAAAVELFGKSLALRDHPETRNALANLLRGTGRSAEAVVHYRAALAARPRWPLPANNLAWILAAHPDDALRDGAEALCFAALACELTGHQIPPILSTLAVAQAEVGDFEAAAATVEKAIALAEQRGDAALVGRLRDRAKSFAERQPVRDPKLLPDAP